MIFHAVLIWEDPNLCSAAWFFLSFLTSAMLYHSTRWTSIIRALNHTSTYQHTFLECSIRTWRTVVCCTTHLKAKDGFLSRPDHLKDLSCGPIRWMCHISSSYDRNANGDLSRSLRTYAHDIDTKNVEEAQRRFKHFMRRVTGSMRKVGFSIVLRKIEIVVLTKNHIGRSSSAYIKAQCLGVAPVSRTDITADLSQHFRE